MTFEELQQHAQQVTNPRELSSRAECGSVGAAILTDKGNVYTGICIDTASSMGFCAEHAAAAAMLTAGEHIIKKIVAVGWRGNIMPPCGRCREFLRQLGDENLNAEVLVEKDTVLLLKDLLPWG